MRLLKRIFLLFSIMTPFITFACSDHQKSTNSVVSENIEEVEDEISNPPMLSLLNSFSTSLTTKNMDSYLELFPSKNNKDIEAEDEYIISKYNSIYSEDDYFYSIYENLPYNGGVNYKNDAHGFKMNDILNDKNATGYIITLNNGDKYEKYNKNPLDWMDLFPSAGLDDKQVDLLQKIRDSYFTLNKEDINWETNTIKKGARVLHFNQPQYLIDEYSKNPKYFNNNLKKEDNIEKEIALLTLASINNFVKMANGKPIIFIGSTYGSNILLSYLSRYKDIKSKFILLSPVPANYKIKVWPKHILKDKDLLYSMNKHMNIDTLSKNKNENIYIINGSDDEVLKEWLVDKPFQYAVKEVGNLKDDSIRAIGRGNWIKKYTETIKNINLDLLKKILTKKNNYNSYLVKDMEHAGLSFNWISGESQTTSDVKDYKDWRTEENIDSKKIYTGDKGIKIRMVNSLLNELDMTWLDKIITTNKFNWE